MELLELRMTTDLESAVPSEIGFNFEELKTSLAQKVEHYNHLVVTEDAIQDAKNDRANLRKLRDAIDNRRKEVKRKFMEPVNIFEAQVKELTALIDAPVGAIDSQIKSFEENQKEEKRSEIAAVYDELVPEALREIIPLNRIMDPKWLNKATSMKSIREMIDKIAKRADVDLLIIDGMNPNYKAAVRAKYIETLDIATAINYQDEIIAAEERFRQQDAARAQREAQAAARAGQVPQVNEKPPVAAQEPVKQQPVPQPRREEKLHQLCLEFQITQTQATALKQFLEANHIQYRKII